MRTEMHDSAFSLKAAPQLHLPLNRHQIMRKSQLRIHHAQQLFPHSQLADQALVLTIHWSKSNQPWDLSSLTTHLKCEVNRLT